MKRRFVYLLLSACLLLTCVAGCTSVPANNTTGPTDPAETPGDPTDRPTDPTDAPTAPSFGTDSSIKVLAIGNSFSVDSMEHLWSMIHSAGYETVVLGNLHASGCSLETHQYNMTTNRKAYTLSVNTDGSWTSSASNAADAVKQENWDVIVIQQVSGYSGDTASYGSLADILAWLEENKPSSGTKILWNMTWAYQSDSGHGDFAKYERDQMVMYNAIIDAVEQQVLTKSAISGVIPTGIAIQNLRASSLGDTITRDGYHLSLGIGRYTAALAWYCFLTGNAADTVTWMPQEYASEIEPHLSEIYKAVDDAIGTELVATPVAPPVDEPPVGGDEPDPTDPTDPTEVPKDPPADVMEIFSGMSTSAMSTIKDKTEAKNALIAAGAYDVHNMFIGGNGRSVATPGGYAGEGYIIQKLSAPAGKTLLAASVTVNYWTYFTTTEPSGAGILTISASTDGINWTEFLYTEGSPENSAVQSFEQDLTEMAEGQRSVYVKVTCQHWGTYEEAAVESILLTGTVEADEDTDTATHTKVSAYYDFTKLSKGNVTAEDIGAIAASKMYFGIDNVPLLTPSGGYLVASATWKLDAADGDYIKDAFITFNGYLRFNNIEMKDRNRLTVYVSGDGVNFIKVEDLHPGNEMEMVKTEIDLTKYLKGSTSMYVKLEWELFESPWVLGIQNLQLDINRESGTGA